MPCRRICDGWDLPTKPKPVEVIRPDGSKEMVTQDRYGLGQIRCMSCNIWLWSDVHKEIAEKEKTSLAPGFAIHTWKNVKDANGQNVKDANGRNVSEPNGDPYAGVYCDCCNSKTRSRAYSTKYQ